MLKRQSSAPDSCYFLAAIRTFVIIESFSRFVAVAFNQQCATIRADGIGAKLALDIANVYIVEASSLTYIPGFLKFE